jgi:hypothetical protein
VRKLLIAAVTGLMALSGGVADAQHWRHGDRGGWDRGGGWEHRGWGRGHGGWDRGYYPRYRAYGYPLIGYEIGVYPYRRYYRHGHWECWRHHYHRVCEWVRW